MDSRTFPSSKRGTNTQVILLLLGTLMPKGTSLAPRRAIIEKPSVRQSRVVSVVVRMDVSAWRVLIPAIGEARVGI